MYGEKIARQQRLLYYMYVYSITGEKIARQQRLLYYMYVHSITGCYFCIYISVCNVHRRVCLHAMSIHGYGYDVYTL